MSGGCGLRPEKIVCERQMEEEIRQNKYYFLLVGRLGSLPSCRVYLGPSFPTFIEGSILIVSSHQS